MRKFWRWKAIWVGHYIHGIFYTQRDFLDHTMWKWQRISEGLTLRWSSWDYYLFEFNIWLLYFLILYYSLAVLYFHCYMQVYTSCGQWGLLFAVVYCCDAQGSAVVAHGFSCSTACGIFLDQRGNLCPLYCRRILNHWRTREVPQEILYQRQKHIPKLDPLGQWLLHLKKLRYFHLNPLISVPCFEVC